jgi:FlaA1/EpsC-like NDP-sugar epimerase
MPGMIFDAIIFGLSLAISLVLTSLSESHLSLADIPLKVWAVIIPSVIGLKLIVFRLARVYRVYWACAGFRDAVKLGLASLGSAFLMLTVMLLTDFLKPFPPTLLLFDLVLTLGATSGLRFFSRALREFWPGQRKGKRAIIVGAGAAGQMIGRELSQNPESAIIPVGYLDDDPAKIGKRIHGIPVLGNLTNLHEIIRRYRASEVIVAIASAPRKIVASIIEDARVAGVDFKIIPRLADIVAGALNVNDIKDIRVADLLGRDKEAPNPKTLRERYSGKTIMVTGAGGSIGSELCRQLAFLGPEKLVLFEINESNLYHLHQKLSDLKAPASLIPVLGDIRDAAGLNRVFAEHHPEIVLHAAAYKHVPLLEDNVSAAINNNVLGTRNLVEAATRAMVERFVLISTDKAVHPSSIMGCTKRIAEFICKQAGEKSSTEFITVRFGNVLDSAGSVVPLFRSQIAVGGPVTVTHRDVTRYFMSIPEASGLVLMAGRIGQKSKVYVLEMGNPFKIDHLAREMIGLAGYVPDKDIEIIYTGLRPGEKLHEELWYAHEELTPTEHPGIMAASSENGLPPDLDSAIDQLGIISNNGTRRDEIAEALRILVPEFQQQEHQTND